MKWIKNCDRISHPSLYHGRMVDVRLESGHEIRAKFWVYQGGEEVAFVLPDTHKELSVKEIYV